MAVPIAAENLVQVVTAAIARIETLEGRMDAMAQTINDADQVVSDLKRRIGAIEKARQEWEKAGILDKRPVKQPK